MSSVEWELLCMYLMTEHEVELLCDAFVMDGRGEGGGLLFP